jgi:tetratricopeptide (TPR) repeat protein
MDRLFEAQLAASPDNPALLLRVASQSNKRGDYRRCSILLGRCINLGVKTFKVYSMRGNALLKLAEAGSRSNQLSSMKQFVEGAIMYNKCIMLGALSGEASLTILVNAARCYFRAGSYEQAVRLLSYLVEILPSSPKMKDEIVEVALQASQSLYALGHVDEAIHYMRFVFNQVTSKHKLKDGNPADDGDNETDSDDEGDVFGTHHGLMSERVLALILGILVQNKAKNKKNNNADDFLPLGAVQYSFYRHRAAAFIANKKTGRSFSSLSATSKKTTRSSNNNFEKTNSFTWSKDPTPWIEAGDACLRRGQPVYASVCYQHASARSQQYELDNGKWQHSLQNRLQTPFFASSLTKFSQSLLLLGDGSPSRNFPSSLKNNLMLQSNSVNYKDMAIHCAHISYQHFRWSIPTRALLEQCEPNQWHHTFLMQSASAVAIQRRVRGIIVRSQSNEDRSARKIQSIYRMSGQKKMYFYLRRSSTMIQSLWRGVAQRMGNVWKRRRRRQATIQISSMWRGHRGRLYARLEKYKQFEKAYLFIQTIARGHIGRQRWRDRYNGIVLLQSFVRGYICRLKMWAIGVLPLIRWTQIGSCFLPITYIRREPNFKMRPDTTNGGRNQIQLLSNVPVGNRRKGGGGGGTDNDYIAPVNIDLTVAGRRLIANPQREVVHTATILNRIRKVENEMNLQINRNHTYSNQQEILLNNQLKNTPDIESMLSDLLKQQENEINEYKKSKIKVTEWLQTAEVEMDRAKRRLKSITPLWINALGLCLIDLNKYGHQPLTFWRVRVQLHLEATKEHLITSYGRAGTEDFIQAIGNVHEDLNMLSANECRIRINVLMKFGESFEKKNNPQFKQLNYDFQETRKKLRHAVKAGLALKRRIKRLNEEREQKRKEIHELSSGTHPSNVALASVAVINDSLNAEIFGNVLINEVASSVGENAAVNITNNMINVEDGHSEEVVRNEFYGRPPRTPSRTASRAHSSPAVSFPAVSSSEPSSILHVPSQVGDFTNSALLTPSTPTKTFADNSMIGSGRSSIIYSQSTLRKKGSSSSDGSTPCVQTVQLSNKEIALKKRLDILIHRKRTRSNIDHLLAEWKRLLAQCAYIGAWKIALECHACMSDQHLPRNEATYRNVVTALKNSKKIVPSSIIAAVLDEMIGEKMTSQRTFHVCMGAIGRDPDSWRHAVVMFQKMKKSGHKANSASYEILTQCCSNADPSDCYNTLKFAGVPEFFSYSISRRSKQIQ